MTTCSKESVSPHNVASDADAFQDNAAGDPISSQQMLCTIFEQIQNNDDGAVGSEAQVGTGFNCTNTSLGWPWEFSNLNDFSIEPEPWTNAAHVDHYPLVNNRDVRVFRQRKESMSIDISANADAGDTLVDNCLDQPYSNKLSSELCSFTFEGDDLPQSGIKGPYNEVATFSTVGAATHDSAHRRAKRQKRMQGFYVCPNSDCSAAYDIASELRKHEQRKHCPEAKLPLGCTHCSRRFFDRRDLNRHVDSRHGGKSTDAGRIPNERNRRSRKRAKLDTSAKKDDPGNDGGDL